MKIDADSIVWICCNPLPPIPLDPKKNKRLIFGRNSDVDVQLPHSCVSRKHATLKSIGDRCLLLQDLGSSNGTFVNGRKITAYPVEIGDSIQIGPYELTIKSQPFDKSKVDLGSTNTNFLTTSSAAAMAGKLEKTSLTEVLQNIEFHDKTGTLYVEGNHIDGFLVFASGKPISAQFGELQDIPAIIGMLQLTKGSFILTDKLEPIDIGIDVTITSILLEFSRLQDESCEAPV